MQYIVFNQEFIKNIISSDENQQAIENHRLISKIDEKGNVNGSLLIFNHK